MLRYSFFFFIFPLPKCALSSLCCSLLEVYKFTSDHPSQSRRLGGPEVQRLQRNQSQKPQGSISAPGMKSHGDMVQGRGRGNLFLFSFSRGAGPHTHLSKRPPHSGWQGAQSRRAEWSLARFYEMANVPFNREEPLSLQVSLWAASAGRQPRCLVR